ncbi:hypothetical protein AAFF_G00146430 [Aldrovandia affinis]|uniref:Uncharacterized protein n=1 Tax=Aldrovandia affinis TaxID=143900 RepID=A0AAD7W8U5_9TELE|nr:hypothetical protein AAFF_G00146430 [Aldrovandia affinis]
MGSTLSKGTLTRTDGLQAEPGQAGPDQWTSGQNSLSRSEIRWMRSAGRLDPSVDSNGFWTAIGARCHEGSDIRHERGRHGRKDQTPADLSRRNDSSALQRSAELSLRPAAMTFCAADVVSSPGLPCWNLSLCRNTQKSLAVLPDRSH